MLVGTSGNNTQSGTYSHAFLYNYTDEVLTDLGTLQNVNGEYGLRSGAADINEYNQVVGSSWLEAANTSLYDPSRYHAFLWENGTITDLNILIDGNSGWVLTAAAAINDRGDIVGTGLLDAEGNGVVESHGFLLTAGTAPPPIANRQPIAVVGANPISGKAPLTVNFSAMGSYDPDAGDLPSYDWDFGDRNLSLNSGP